MHEIRFFVFFVDHKLLKSVAKYKQYCAFNREKMQLLCYPVCIYWAVFLGLFYMGFRQLSALQFLAYSLGSCHALFLTSNQSKRNV